MEREILVVEDESSMREVIVEFLRDSNYLVDEAENGLEALKYIKNKNYSLIITDIMMPKMDGYQLVNKIRENSSVPIIVLTALSSQADQIKAYDLSADDFITKPFSPIVLVKKVDAMIRRVYNKNDLSSKPLSVGNITIDKENWHVIIDDKNYDLSVKEFDLFYALVDNAGKVLSREWLLKKIWDYDFLGDTRIIDTQIKNIRKKIGNNIIETVHGVGYKVEINGNSKK